MAPNFDHSIFAELLQSQGKNGLVDCRVLKRNQAKRIEYWKQLDQVGNEIPPGSTTEYPFLSSIFAWCKEDSLASADGRKQFGSYSQAEIGVIEFIMKYISNAEQNYIIQQQPKLKYPDYDWSLNEQKK